MFELNKYEKECSKKFYEKQAYTYRNNIVLNEGAGEAINMLYQKWYNIKTESDRDNFKQALIDTKFGTYGTIPFHEVLNNFNPKFQSDFIKNSFLSETKKILK